jgi:hypothetical protein
MVPPAPPGDPGPPAPPSPAGRMRGLPSRMTCSPSSPALPEGPVPPLAPGAFNWRRRDGLGVDTHRSAGGYRHRHHRCRAQRIGHDEVIPPGGQAVQLTGRGPEHHRVTRARCDAEGRKLTGQRIVDRELVAEEVVRAHGNPCIAESDNATVRRRGRFTDRGALPILRCGDTQISAAASPEPHAGAAWVNAQISWCCALGGPFRLLIRRGVWHAWRPGTAAAD